LFNLILISNSILILFIAIFFIIFLIYFIFQFNPLLFYFIYWFILDLILLIAIYFIFQFWLIENFTSWFFRVVFYWLTWSHDSSYEFQILDRFDFGFLFRLLDL
jgi:hypothetical protein